MKATVKEDSIKFDSKLDAQRKNQLRKLRDVMNARRKKKNPGGDQGVADQHADQGVRDQHPDQGERSSHFEYQVR